MPSDLIKSQIDKLLFTYTSANEVVELIKKETARLEDYSVDQTAFAFKYSRQEKGATPQLPASDYHDSCEEETSKNTIDEVFDNIPQGVKVVFISYSWDNDDHKSWVLRFSNALVEYGIYVLLDQYLTPGYSLTLFMNRGIERADKVIIVGTPTYKQKSQNYTSGGAVYEDSIIQSSLMQNIVQTKFIPLLRKGSFEKSFPSLISTRIGFDLKDDSHFESIVKEVVKSINGIPSCRRPVLGSKAINATPKTVASGIKENDNSSELTFEQAMDTKWVNRLLEQFSFDLMHEYVYSDPTSIDMRMVTSFDMWNSLILQPSFKIFDKELNSLIMSFYSKWAEVVNLGMPYYSTTQDNRASFFGLQDDSFVSDEAEETFKKIVNLKLEMQPLLKDMANYIMDHFHVNIEETSRNFILSLKRTGYSSL